MSASVIVWVAMAAILLLMSVRRPVWAVALYMQTYFAAPQLWWWGDDIPQLRYALWAGIILLVATAFASQTQDDGAEHPRMGSHKAAVFMAINATIVHVAFAVNRGISLNTYTELLKYALLFYLLHLAIRDRKDFRIALVTLALGGLYIGWEITVNGRGDISGSRLEGVGAPGADTSNGLASLMLTILPLAGSLWVQGSWKHKALAVLSAPLILNVLLLCNSRGAFLGLIGAGVAFLIVARGQTRKRAFKTLALGAVALFLLLGDPKILDRFSTTFVGGEARDNSAASRLEFWRAGLRMLEDYPLGAGGAAFKEVLGRRYLASIVGEENAEARSLHNGFLTEATDWGVQGLVAKVLFIGFALVALYRTLERCRKENRTNDALIGLSIWASAAGLLITCVFGSFLASEWTFWLVALAVRYSQLYATGEEAQRAGLPVPAAAQGGIKAA
jgi:putative inorganic carbon (hco3(-)) transporter